MADDYSINAKITADASGFKKGIKDAQNASQSFSKSVSGMIQGLGKSGLVGALGAVGLATGGVTAVLGVAKKAIQAVSKTVAECSEAYRKQYQAEIALETAVNNSPYVDGSATRALKSFASEMQSISNLGDEEILPMMTKLIASGRSQAETMDIIRVATDMSADGTISFETAVNQLNLTLNGNIGRLGMQNAELKELTDEELKNGKAVEILGNKYKGLASATADTSKQLKNAIGDLKEAVGKTFENALSPMRKYFTEVVTNLTNSINKARDLKDAMKEVFTDDGVNTGSTTDNLTIAFNQVLAKQREVTQNQKQYLELYGAYIDKTTDEVYLSYQNQISELNKQIKEISEELNKRKRESDAQAKARKEADEQAEAEKKINDLKQKYLDKIAEQEAKWNNIKIVTGEAVKNEEKLKFYQEQLVAIMTESGGAISKNNQYYKDQKKIIDDLIKLIQEEGGSLEDLSDDISDSYEESLSAIQKFFKDLSEELQANMKTLKDYVKIVNQSTAKMLHQLGYELAKGEVSWKSYAKIAVEGIAEVLKGLSAQLSALAVVKVASYDYATAAVLAAGATASMIASGALTAVAEGFDNISTSAKEAGETVTKSAEEIKQALENIESTSSRTASNLFVNINKFSEQAEKAQESIDAMKSEFTDLQNKSTNAYLKYQDAFEEYLNKLKNMTRQGAEYYYQQTVKPLKDASDKISKEFKKVADEYNGLQDDLRSAKKAMREEGIKIFENLKAESDAVRGTVTTYKTLYKAQTDYITARKKWDRLTTKQKAISQAEYLLGKNGTLYEEVKTLSTYVNIIFEEQLGNVSKTVSDIYSQLTNAGKKVGETLASSVISGASKTDFLKSMKDYIRENLIKLAVYTESFQDKLADIGGSLANALVSGTTSELRTVKKELENLYDEATKNAKKAENVISSVFGDIGEDIQSTISNFGGNIATTLVDSLANGLNQSDFLDSVKKWIRKMLIQSVVYTKTMKAELEAIGEAISRGISEGFTETSFHEIRRDLSWVFDQANKTISNIDDILNSVFGSGYATGTNNATSGLHLVGEAGPELVRFRGGEKVINASNTNKALAGMGGTTINQNVTFNNLADTSAFAMMNQFKQYNRQLAINSVF